MDLTRLIEAERNAYLDVSLRCMGGNSGPSSSQLIAQEEAAKARAQAEADKIKAETDQEKMTENAKSVAGQVAQANADAARRAKNRTLLAGLEEEERVTPLLDGTGSALDMSLEDPTSTAGKKRRTAKTLIVGG